MSTVLARLKRKGVSFHCRACAGTETMVVDSRPAMIGRLPAIRRRRRCTGCSERFSTVELELIEVERVPTLTGEMAEVVTEIEQAVRRLVILTLTKP